MTDDVTPITLADFHEADWRLLSEGACALFRTSSYAAAAQFVQAISEIPGLEGRNASIDIRPGGVTVRLLTVTQRYYGISSGDVALARAISEVAREQGLAAEPVALQTMLVIPGAPNIAEVMPFWQAILGYEPRLDSPDEDLVDPQGVGPPFWFEQMEAPRADGGGAIHLAIWVPYEQAEARVQAALAAGGHMVRDEFAPSWWTLADAAGNEADIATAMNRD